MLPLLNTDAIRLWAGPTGDSVSHATHTHYGLAGLVPLLCPAALPSLLFVTRVAFRRVCTYLMGWAFHDLVLFSGTVDDSMSDHGASCQIHDHALIYVHFVYSHVFYLVHSWVGSVYTLLFCQSL